MHAKSYLTETANICRTLDHDLIDRLAARLSLITGRLYIFGLGGSMANAIHMAADFRKLCDIDAEAYSNIAEITARMNDEGPGAIIGGWLARSTPSDALFILSVGGGTPHVSPSILYAVRQAADNGTPVFAITGPEGGAAARGADIVIRIPMERMDRITPHTEAFQAVIWHLLVSHPLLQKNRTTW